MATVRSRVCAQRKLVLNYNKMAAACVLRMRNGSYRVGLHQDGRRNGHKAFLDENLPKKSAKSKGSGKSRAKGKKSKKTKQPKPEVDILSPAAMLNAYYISHNAVDCLGFRGFSWPEAPKKKGKKLKKK
ncbi:small lysine-rich protein 1 [Pelodytes ibericus]